jgi:DNA polymerase (family 10)
MTNKDIAQTFQLLANLMELHDGDPFRIRSYQFVSQNIKVFNRPLNEISSAELANIKGIGKSIASQITEFIETGRLSALDKLIDVTPPGLLKLIQMKGFGPKKVKQLWAELGIETPGELLYAIQENRLLSLKGFGEKSQNELLHQVQFLLSHENYFLYPELFQESLAFQEIFNTVFPGFTIELTGDVKRKLPYADLIEFIVDGFTNEIDLLKIPGITSFTLSDSKYDVIWKMSYKMTLYFSNRNNFIHKYVLLTGNDSFTERISTALVQQESPDFKNEAELFKWLNVELVPPELREYPLNEVSDEKLLNNLIQISDIKGVVHAHSRYSDGTNTIAEMARYAENEGYSYLVMTDHSQAAFYANGLKWEAIKIQHDEIDALNSTNKRIRILKGIECDILPSGELDYDKEILSTFEVVIASIHSLLKMNEERAMARIIRAIENPFTNILGHPTGRLLLSRPGYPLDMKKIIDACSANKVAIELNANPRRLDLDWHWIPYALEKMVLISINPDAHSTKGIHDIQYGVNMARKGKLTKDNCLNSFDVDSFLRAIQK